MIVLAVLAGCASADIDMDAYNLVWESSSKNSCESMPCGGCDIGLNVWVEGGDILFYVSQSGTFDENNGMLKFGRVRLTLSPNPFDDFESFCQTLKLKEGYVEIVGRKGGQTSTVNIWVDAMKPVIHVDVDSKEAVSVTASYEYWRTSDRELSGQENQNNRSYFGTPVKAVLREDTVEFRDNDIVAYHRNDDEKPNCFDLCVEQQGLENVKGELWNPLENLTFGGLIRGEGMKRAGFDKGRYASADFKSLKLTSKQPECRQGIDIYLHVDRCSSAEAWKKGLDELIAGYDRTEAQKQTLAWWEQFWDRSYIAINPETGSNDDVPWTLGRNYQLFRYQLGCNARGEYPTKFNGGLFTCDPEYIESGIKCSPDFRRWGGGSFTAQNQRLVYWPMIKSGDFDMMRPQFEFYLRILKNAELRTKEYWGHDGACFVEQIENFGLPVAFEYGWKRPGEFDPGVQYNSWVEYQWDTALEFCWMILEYQRYCGSDISRYLPLIESCLTFFDEHYQMLSMQRTTHPLDENGHLVLYPGTACETYKMATNAVPTVAALQSVVNAVLQLPSSCLTDEKREHYAGYLKRIPPISFRQKNGCKTIAPAERYERINNCELPQLYPVYPYGIYGIGRDDLQVAVDTWKYGADRENQKNIISWHQDGIFCARLGLTDEAADIAIQKMGDSPRRCPTFWGPGHDWVPDHNWGGSGMIGLQEMLMQAVDEKIYLLPAWPKDWDVNFKLHAPFNTIIKGSVVKGKVEKLTVVPDSRMKDIVICGQ